jgi:tetratricopeptide (TPR) repeat protein
MGRPRRHVNFFRTLAVGGSLSLLAAASVRPAHAAAAERARFRVVAFAHEGGPRSLDFLQAALPALVAERMALHPGLRFAGPSQLVDRAGLEETQARAAAAGVRYVVAGSYARRPDWRVRVAIDVYDGGQKAGHAEAEGAKDEVARVALAAALDAFEAAGLPTPGDRRAAIHAPFARDPYAFVLYGRGVAAEVGLDGHAASPERAQQALSKSLVIDPKVPEARRYLGLVHLLAGRPGHARALWSYAVEVRPDYVAAIAGLAALDRTQGLPSARDRYARLLELDPDDLEARRAHGELLADAGQLEEARAELEEVVAALPGDLRARRTLALVLGAGRAGDELAAELAEIVRLDPEDLDARLDLGAAYASLGKVDAALESYEEVLRHRPRHGAALKIAADLYRAKGDPAKAAAYYERLRRVAPDDPRPLFLLGASYYEAGRLDAAERMFTEGAHYPGMLGDAYSNLGAIAYRRGHYKEAVWFLSRAAQRRPQKAGVRYNYALALQAVERYDDALRELAAAAGVAPDDAEVRFLGGVVALRLGRLAEAEDQFKEAARLDPAHEGARFNLDLLQSLRASPAEAPFAVP